MAGAVEATALRVEAGQDAEAGASEPRDAISLERTVHAADPGSQVLFRLNEGCASADDYGPKRCRLGWGQKVSFLSKVHVASGVQFGDVLVLNASIKIKAQNESDPMSQLLAGNQIFAQSACSLCSGQCNLQAKVPDKGYLLELEQPSYMDGPELCEGLLRGNGVQDFDLADWTWQLPEGFPAAWQLRASVELGLAFLRQDGRPKVAEKVVLDLVPGAAAPQALKAPKAAMPIMAARLTAGGARTLPEALVAVLAGVLSEAAVHPAAAELMRTQPGWEPARLNALRLKMSARNIEDKAGQNFSFMTSHGCEVQGKDKATVSCWIPLGQEARWSVGLHLASNLEHGSFVKLKLMPKVGGMLGVMMGAALQPIEVVVPLCDGGSNITFMDVDIPVQAGDCGPYRMNLELPDLSVTLPTIKGKTLGDLGFPQLPRIPIRLDELPPMSIVASMQYRHQDETPIADVDIEVGLAHAKEGS
mmetsp:Transcript_39073/g.124217  ORF Transcript_39073/g.124217 Transcript_39073/m.124217 type:complete len:475 (+) Transcript_39073:983-2407(+)